MVFGRRPLLAFTLLSAVASTFISSGFALTDPVPARKVPPSIQPRAGDPLPALSALEKLKFKAGRLQFQHSFTPAEGLGPIFNKDSCAFCHGGIGSNFPPIGGGSVGLTMNVRRFGLSNTSGFDPLTALGGSLLQMFSIPAPVGVQSCGEVVPTQANVNVQRTTTPIFGAGLVEALDDAQILANTAIAGVSGVAHIVTPLESSTPRVGRFGWKAQQATLKSFSADASLNELGITTPLLPAENAPNGNSAILAACDAVSDPEVSPNASGTSFIQQIEDFQRYLAAPPQTPKAGTFGERVFRQIGCDDCHVTSYTTPNNSTLPNALRSVSFNPYSDFLLHDMGSMADGVAQGAAQMNEIRTPALWGIRNRSFLWHDGRFGLWSVSALDQIIAAHDATGSEGHTSASKYQLLSPANKQALFDFLRTLGRPEFDLRGNYGSEDDLHVNRIDLPDFIQCYYGAQEYSPDTRCARADINQDQKVDSADLLRFTQAYSRDENQFDCNCNAQNDLSEVVYNPTIDSNLDGYPDSCHVALNLSYYPQQGMPNDPLSLGEQIQINISGAQAGASIKIFISLTGAQGGISNPLSPPYNNVCVNVGSAVDLSTLLSYPQPIANASGQAHLTITLPNAAPFNQASKVALQAIAIPLTQGILMRSEASVREVVP